MNAQAQNNGGASVTEAIANVDARHSGDFRRDPTASGALLQAKQAEGRKLTDAITKQPPVDPMLQETLSRLSSDGEAVKQKLKETNDDLTKAMEEFADLSNRIAVLNQKQAKLQQQSIAITMSRTMMQANFKLQVPDAV